MINIKMIILLAVLELVLIELAFEIHDLIKSYKIRRMARKLFDEELEGITKRVREGSSDTAKQAVDEEVAEDER